MRMRRPGPDGGSSRSRIRPAGGPPPAGQGWHGCVRHRERHGDSIRLRTRIIDHRRRSRIWELPAESGTIAAAEEILSRVDSRVAGAWRSGSPTPSFSRWRRSRRPWRPGRNSRLGSSWKSPPADPESCSDSGWRRPSTALFRWSLIHAALSALKSPFPRGGRGRFLLRDLDPARRRMSLLEDRLMTYMLAVRAEDWEGCYRAIREAASIAPDSSATRKPFAPCSCSGHARRSPRSPGPGSSGSTGTTRRTTGWCSPTPTISSATSSRARRGAAGAAP